MEIGGGVEGFAGVAEKERVRAGGEVSEGVVDQVRGRVAEEFALSVSRPETAVTALQNTLFPRLRPNAPHVPSFVRARAGKYWAMVGVMCEEARHRDGDFQREGDVIASANDRTY